MPAADRASFDRLLTEGRACYGCLDDNSGMAIWTMGVLRRACLEVARRAVARGALGEATDVFDLTADELFALGGGAKPGSS